MQKRMTLGQRILTWVMSALAVLMCPLLIVAPVALTGCTSDQLATFDNSVNTLEAHLPQLAQMATGLTALVAPEYAPLVAPGAAVIATDAGLIKTLVDDLKITPDATKLQKVDALWQDINSNLQNIVTAVGFKNPKSTAAVNLFAGFAGEIIQFIEDLGTRQAPTTARILLPHVFGWNISGMHAMAYSTGDREADAVIVAMSDGPPVKTKTRPKLSAREIAKAWNKLAVGNAKAKIPVPRAHILGVPIPFTGAK